MIIFYGSKVRSKKIGQTKEACHCDHCDNTSIWTLYNDKKWFTLFFIPIFPFSSKKFLSCPVCGWGISVDDKNSDRIMPMIEISYSLLMMKINLF